MKFFKYVAPALLGGLLLALTGCGDTIVSTDKSANVTGTLQGKLMDAVTGAPITDTAQGDTKMYLVKGTEQRVPSKLNTFVPSGSTNLPGEYAFTNIPVTNGSVDGAAAVDAVYKVVVKKTGYQDFEAEFSFTGNYHVTKDGTVKDTDYNKIGNIYLFPTGSTAPDYTVTVKYNGKVVPNAIVQLQQTVDLNSATTVTQGGVTNFGLTGGFDTNRLLASKGLYPTLSVTTDANGKAVFAGSTLVLGGAYNPVVLPCKDADGIQLARTMGTAFVVGVNAGVASEISQTITPDTLLAGDNTNGLYIASVSTATTSGTLVADGSLVITFSRAVELNNSATANVPTGAAAPYAADTVFGYYATLSSTALTQTAALSYAQLDTAAHAALKPVSATLSADGLTLTLKPNYATNSAATDYDLAITYAGTTAVGAITYNEPTINVKGFPEKQYTLFGSSGTQLLKSTGAVLTAAERKVNILGPRP